jgi:hypothetical protein
MPQVTPSVPFAVLWEWMAELDREKDNLSSLSTFWKNSIDHIAQTRDALVGQFDALAAGWPPGSGLTREAFLETVLDDLGTVNRSLVNMGGNSARLEDLLHDVKSAYGQMDDIYTNWVVESTGRKVILDSTLRATDEKYRQQAFPIMSKLEQHLTDVASILHASVSVKWPAGHRADPNLVP